MAFKAVFLDFYGTLVHEDDDIIPIICEQIKQNASAPCSVQDIGAYWWQRFSHMCRNSFGDTFQDQRTLGLLSLEETIKQFGSACDAEELIQMQFEHWAQPKIYADTIPFFQTLHGMPMYILSNIDTSDVRQAMAFHGLQATEVFTSEDVRAYKPRPELFLKALDYSGFKAEEVIHIGDSATSDVSGAQNVGIRAVWLNRINKTLPDGVKPDYVCNDLNEVLAIGFQGVRA